MGVDSFSDRRFPGQCANARKLQKGSASEPLAGSYSSAVAAPFDLVGIPIHQAFKNANGKELIGAVGGATTSSRVEFPFSRNKKQVAPGVEAVGVCSGDTTNAVRQ